MIQEYQTQLDAVQGKSPREDSLTDEQTKGAVSLDTNYFTPESTQVGAEPK